MGYMGVKNEIKPFKNSSPGRGHNPCDKSCRLSNELPQVKSHRKVST